MSSDPTDFPFATSLEDKYSLLFYYPTDLYVGGALNLTADAKARIRK